jgi:hypothetical protein
MADQSDIDAAEWRGEVTATLKTIRENLHKLNEFDRRLRAVELRVYAIGAAAVGILKLFEGS